MVTILQNSILAASTLQTYMDGTDPLTPSVVGAFIIVGILFLGIGWCINLIFKGFGW